MSDDLDGLGILREIVKARAALDEREREAVKRLREQSYGYYYGGTPWEKIAEALGISRQAAMKRHADALAATGDHRHHRRWDAGRPRAQT